MENIKNTTLGGNHEQEEDNEEFSTDHLKITTDYNDLSAPSKSTIDAFQAKIDKHLEEALKPIE